MLKALYNNNNTTKLLNLCY